VHNLSRRNKAMTHVGWFQSPLVLSMSAAKSGKTFGVHINLELYQDADNALTVLIQRAPPIKGFEQCFADALVKWASSLGFSRLLFLGGAASKSVGKSSLLSLNGAATKEGFPANLAKTIVGWKTWTRQEWTDELPYSGMLRPFLLACEALDMKATSLVMPVAEGDNFLDGLRMAHATIYALSTTLGHTNLHLALSSSDAKDKRVTLEMPASWRRIESDDPLDGTMY